MKPGHTKLEAWKRTEKLMQKYGGGVAFTTADLVRTGMTVAEAKSQVAMFKRRNMLKVYSRAGRMVSYVLTRKTFRREARRIEQRSAACKAENVVPKPKPAAVQFGEIFIAINGSKLMVDAPGLIFEMVGRIHLKVDG